MLSRQKKSVKHTQLLLWILSVLFVIFSGCAEKVSTKPAPSSMIQTPPQIVPSPSSLTSWAYWLADPDLVQLAQTPQQLIVMDYSADGSDERRFSRDAVDYLHEHGKLVLSYLSIGEANSFRFYWNSSWAKTPPDFLGPENSDWPQAYKVRYWDPEWRNCLKPYIKRIVEAGFDGVYLDIVDAYWFWGEHGEDVRQTANRMAELIFWTADYARSLAQGRFLVCIQNGLGIFDDASPIWSEKLMRAIDMASVESLFYNYYSKEDQAYRIEMLQKLAKHGKTLLDVEYIPPELTAEYLQKIHAAPVRLIPYRAAPDRALDSLAGP
jgi:cysteinyl-tRNA synthetase